MKLCGFKFIESYLPPPPKCWDSRCAVLCLASEKGVELCRSRRRTDCTGGIVTAASEDLYG